MNKLQIIIRTLVLVLVLLLTLPYARKIFGILFLPKQVGVLQQLSIYKWVGVGIIAYIVIHRIIKKNIEWLETLSHELTHSVVAMLFLRRVHSLYAEEGSGVIYTSGKSSFGHVPMSLAPYTIPLFTFLLLSIRCLMDFHGMWIYDILIGITIGFHFFCFKSQTHSNQTDINQFPLFFSYLYIFTVLLINILIILVAFFPQYNLYTSFWRWLTAVWGNLTGFFAF